MRRLVGFQRAGQEGFDLALHRFGLGGVGELHADAGAAIALGLSDEMGQIEPGQFADLAIWDWANGPVAEHRDAIARAGHGSLHERAFVWMTLGDERNLVSTLVAGETVYSHHSNPNLQAA